MPELTVAVRMGRVWTVKALMAEALLVPVRVSGLRARIEPERFPLRQGRLVSRDLPDWAVVRHRLNR